MVILSLRKTESVRGMVQMADICKRVLTRGRKRPLLLYQREDMVPELLSKPSIPEVWAEMASSLQVDVQDQKTLPGQRMAVVAPARLLLVAFLPQPCPVIRLLSPSSKG